MLIEDFVEGKDGGGGFGIVECRQAAEGVAAEVIIGEDEAERVGGSGILSADQNLNRFAALLERRIVVADHPA